MSCVSLRRVYWVQIIPSAGRGAVGWPTFGAESEKYVSLLLLPIRWRDLVGVGTVRRFRLRGCCKGNNTGYSQPQQPSLAYPESQGIPFPSEHSFMSHFLLSSHVHSDATSYKVNLSQYLTNLMHKNLFHNKFYFMPLHVSRTCAHHQEVKIALHSLWYNHTYRCDDTRGCVMQFWPTDDEHICSKLVEAWNKTYCNTNFVH